MLDRKLTTHNYARAFWIPHTDHFSVWAADIVWADNWLKQTEKEEEEEKEKTT